MIVLVASHENAKLRARILFRVVAPGARALGIRAHERADDSKRPSALHYLATAETALGNQRPMGLTSASLVILIRHRRLPLSLSRRRISPTSFMSKPTIPSDSPQRVAVQLGAVTTNGRDSVPRVWRQVRSDSIAR